MFPCQVDGISSPSWSRRLGWCLSLPRVFPDLGCCVVCAPSPQPPNTQAFESSKWMAQTICPCTLDGDEGPCYPLICEVYCSVILSFFDTISLSAGGCGGLAHLIVWGCCTPSLHSTQLSTLKPSKCWLAVYCGSTSRWRLHESTADSACVTPKRCVATRGAVPKRRAGNRSQLRIQTSLIY